GGSQANQLVMDDTQGQVQVHLKSDHQSSELNLGYITRIPDSSGRKDYRGQGFELRTDGHGVIRSAKGMILTTYAKNQAESYAKNIQNTTAQLKQAIEQHKTQTQTAINQKADERSLASTAQTDLATQEKAISGSGEQAELQAAQVVVGSSTGVAVVAEQSIHLNSNEQIALTSGKDVSLAVGERLFASANQGISLFTQSKGVRLFAGKDKIELQAQNGGLDAIARQNIQIISTEDKIEVTSPKEIILTAGGSQLLINSSGVFIKTGGKFEVKAGQHLFESGERVSYSLPFVPALINLQSELCPIKQVYSEPVVYAPPITTNSLVASNTTPTSSTPTSSTVKCSSHIPKKEDKNYDLRFPVKNNYNVDEQGIKISNILNRWEEISRRKFDLLYDPALNKITAKVIIKIQFMEAQQTINGVVTNVPYDKNSIQNHVSRPYDAIKLATIKTKIEETLNKEIKYLTPVQCNQAGGCACKIPMYLEVEFVENGRFHQKVNLFPKSPRPNTDNWAEERLDTNNQVMSPDREHALAHEVGHYFNFPDEYYFSGGMVHKMYINPRTKIVDLTIPEPVDDWKRYSLDNLMGQGATKLDPELPKYYFNFIKDWFERKTRIQWNIVT
ncbi:MULTISPECIES: type VI secretion system Vgr family protein, partial [unclassified Acinetobacter]